MNADAAIKIKMLEDSLCCFTLGLFGLLPVIGLPFALIAIWISGSVRVKEKRFWNAAKPYRVWGMVCAAFGAIAWSGILILVIGHFILFGRNPD
jgi:hypothetical protein